MRLALCLAALLVAAPALAGDGYVVGPRDTLHIEFFADDAVSRDVVVSEAGVVRLLHLEPLTVAGLTVDEVHDLLHAEYGALYLEPELDVTVKDYRSHPVDVVGAVKRVGTYYLEGPTTLRQILTEAGWVEAARSNGEVYVKRADGETEVLTLAQLSSGHDVPIYAHDAVTVPEGQFVYVDGEVGKPGAILFNEGMTVTQAMARAGGASQLAWLKRAYVLRDNERIPVNLKKILAGRETDMVMRPGDQLFVKENPL